MEKVLAIGLALLTRVMRGTALVEKFWEHIIFRRDYRKENIDYMFKLIKCHYVLTVYWRTRGVAFIDL